MEQRQDIFKARKSELANIANFSAVDQLASILKPLQDNALHVSQLANIANFSAVNLLANILKPLQDNALHVSQLANIANFSTVNQLASILKPLQDNLLNHYSELVSSSKLDNINQLGLTQINIPKLQTIITDLDMSEYIEPIEIENKEIYVGKVQQIINSCLENKIENHYINIEKGINELIDISQKQKEPFIKTLLVAFLIEIIMQVMFCFVFPKIGQVIQRAITDDPKIVCKIIKKDLSGLKLDNTMLRDYRFVAVNSLNVRITNKKNSQLVGKLYIGQVVKIINKNKNWSLVEWVNDNQDVKIKGWVFTRYISRFK
jgi:hypothetical protein